MPRLALLPLFGLMLAPLSGCNGLGRDLADTANPFQRPFVVASNTTENVATAHGKLPPRITLRPAPGQPWPTSYPMDPTIMDIERSGSGVP